MVSSYKNTATDISPCFRRLWRVGKGCHGPRRLLKGPSLEHPLDGRLVVDAIAQLQAMVAILSRTGGSDWRELNPIEIHWRCCKDWLGRGRQGKSDKMGSL
jgi:hypothetical protein